MSRERAQQIIAHEIPTHRAPDMTSDEIAGRALDALKAEGFGLFRHQDVLDQHNLNAELIEALKALRTGISAYASKASKWGSFDQDGSLEAAEAKVDAVLAKAEGSAE